jgi:hypothetical protein
MVVSWNLLDFKNIPACMNRHLHIVDISASVTVLLSQPWLTPFRNLLVLAAGGMDGYSIIE